MRATPMGAASSPEEIAKAAGGSLLRVLVVDGDGGLAGELEAVLADAPEGERLALSTAAGAAVAYPRLAAGAADVVLLPVAAGEGLAPLVTLRAEAPTVPVVVLCAAGDEPLAVKAVQLGAADYLVRERLYGTVVARSLRHAVETERVRAALARHQAEWLPALGGGAASRPAPLRVALPETFAELVRRYGELLDAAVEQVLQRRSPALDERLQQLAASAAELRAGPRDVIDLHAAAMKQREAEQGAQRMKIYLAEGRLRLLELMGYLVTYYRDRWLAGTRPGPP